MRRKSSYIIQFVLLLGFMTVANTANAQWHKWHFGGGVGSLTYYGDLSDKFVNANLQELGYHAYVERLIAKRSGIYWRLESVNGHLLGSDRAPGGWINGTSSDFDRSLNFRTRIHDVNTSLIFYFGNRSKRERAPFLNAYVRAGIGVGYFDVSGDLKDADGNFYNYWSDGTIRNLPQNAPNSSEANVISRDYDFETNLNELAIEKSYNRFKWQIPVGLGLKMRLGNAVSLILDAQYTYAMTDYLDNVGDSRTRSDITDPNILRAADPAGYIGDRPRNLDKPTGLNDGYLYVSAGLNFNVGKNEKPKFKAPVYYPKTITPVQPDTTIAEETIIEHPLDSIAKSVGQTIEKDTTTHTTTPFITLQKADSDSLFISLFEENYQQWWNKDSVTAGKTIDSVALTKVPEEEDTYIARYYEKHTVDSLLHKDTSVLLQTDTLQLDLQKRAILRDSAYYPSAQTIANSSDSLNNSDSLHFYIQQLRLQLDNLEKQMMKDSVKLNPVAPSAISDTSIKSLEPKRDSIRAGTEKKTDSLSLKTRTSDTLNYTPANYSATARDSIRKDSLPKASIPKDSIRSQSITVARVVRDTSAGKIDTLKSVVADSISKTGQNPEDSLQLSQLRQAEIKRQIADLQKQLDSSKDTIQPVAEYKTAAADTTSKATLEDLKKRMAELENASTSKADTILQSSKTTAGNYKIAADTIKAEKDSVIVKNQASADSSSNKRLSGNYKIAADTIKAEKDSIIVKNRASADSSSNKRLEELKKKIVKADSLSYQKADSNNKAAGSKESLKQKADSARVETETLKGNTPASADSSYNKRIEDLKRRLDELENTSKKVDTVKAVKVDTTSTMLPSDIKKDSVKSTNNARMATPSSQKETNPENEALKNKIAELEQQIALQKGKEDSLKSAAAQYNAPSSARSAAPPSNTQQDELLRRITDLENQLKTTQNAAANQNNSPSANSYYQAKIDSLNNAIAYQRLMGGYSAQPTQPYYDHRPAVNPVIQPVVSIPVGSGNGRERREEKRARKAAEKERQLELQSESELSSESENSSGTTPKLAVGSTKEKGPGYFEAKRLKKEEAGQSEKTDSTEMSTDSTDVLVDSSATDLNIRADIESSDSTLQAENQWLKAQISDIQKNQDSLLLILNSLLTKVAEPVAQPAPIVVEKEGAPKIDSAQIIAGILAQPSTKVFFAVGKSALGSQYKTSLDQLANQMRNHPDLKLELKGFADPTGNAAANMLLSEKRAQSVKSYLLQVHNISPDKISVLPVGQENNSSDMSYSRRVEVKLVK